MTTPTEKERKPGSSPTTGKKFRPSKQTVAVRPYKYKQPTKAEMYEDLRKAVENTTSLTRGLK
jgi:hypothetical protein